MKLFHITTVPETLFFLSRQVGFIQQHRFDVHVVSSPGPELEMFGERERVVTHGISMTRDISPFGDLYALIKLFALFRSEKPKIVHAHTPKAALVSMLAAWAARVPCRIFHIHGLPHSTANGLVRKALICSTRISCRFATRVLSVSQSAANAAVSEGFCSAKKILVPAGGSINGVDALGKFCPKTVSRHKRAELLGLGESELVVGFAGRLVRDKGVCELYEAWRDIRTEFPNAHLVIAGPPEKRDALPVSLVECLHRDPRVLMLGAVKDMPAFYASLDLFVLPTYREGLPTVLLESAAMALPSVATHAVGCVDAVIDGKTGSLVPVGDAVALAGAIRTYLLDPALRKQHGNAARARVIRDFKPEDVWTANLNEYREALAASARRGRLKFFGMAIKRALDIAVSGIGLLTLAPLLLFIAFFVRLRIGSPLLFRQLRPGQNGRPFSMCKFRTMRDTRDSEGRLLPDAERLTRSGSFLRRTSLDELPELWNVLKGDMSLVGPRPLLTRYLNRYTDFENRRHEVKPGITGWAQVNGRNSLTWSEKFALDVWYVDHRSFWLDLRILAATVISVLSAAGVNKRGHATEQEFMGS